MTGAKRSITTDYVNEEMPFVAAAGLLEAIRARLTDEEAALVAVSLYTLLPPEEGAATAWKCHGNIASISRRY